MLYQRASYTCKTRLECVSRRCKWLTFQNQKLLEICTTLAVNLRDAWQSMNKFSMKHFCFQLNNVHEENTLVFLHSDTWLFWNYDLGPRDILAAGKDSGFQPQMNGTYSFILIFMRFIPRSISNRWSFESTKFFWNNFLFIQMKYFVLFTSYYLNWSHFIGASIRWQNWPS